MTFIYLQLSKTNTELCEYIYKREVSDVLKEHLDGVMSANSLLKLLKPLQPRYYSISSSPLHVQFSIFINRVTSHETNIV